MSPPIVNPCTRRPPEGRGSQQSEQMGPQSQRRNTLQERTHQLASASKRKKRKPGQCTLFGEEAFDPLKHCEVCKARLWGRSVHRAHHKLCSNNRRTRGVTSTTQLKQAKIDKALRRHFNSPLPTEARFDWRHSTKEAGEAFFAPRATKKTSNHPQPETQPTPDNMDVPSIVSAEELCAGVSAKVDDQSFLNEFKHARAPLAVLALAKLAVEKIIRGPKKNCAEYFDGLTMTVPGCKTMHNNLQHHSIVGQKLLLVDWKKAFGLEVSCPREHCEGTLENDRTNFSKNKLSFPVFGLDELPHSAWHNPCGAHVARLDPMLTMELH